MMNASDKSECERERERERGCLFVICGVLDFENFKMKGLCLVLYISRA